MKFSDKHEFFKFLDGVIEEAKEHVNRENYNFQLCSVTVMISIIESQDEAEAKQTNENIRASIERRN